jgi:3-oxoacyl-[acyl-carrier protein] reductase
VNNAGIVRDRSFLKMTDEDWELVLRIHAGGTFWCAQEAAIRMRAQGTGGAIVNTVSAAHMGNFGQTNYGGAKGAIASMIYTWANELSRYGIRVNAISPSGTTRMSESAKGADGKVVSTPFVDPTLNGPLVAYLCSDEGNWITGQVFGSGGDRVVIMEHPKYGTGMFKPGGWTVEDLREHMPKFFKGRLEPVGLFKKAYPYYDGVKPQAE